MTNDDRSLSTLREQVEALLQKIAELDLRLAKSDDEIEALSGDVSNVVEIW